MHNKTPAERAARVPTIHIISDSIGETAQVVIPVTAQPLVLTLRILRIQSTREGETFYAARFIDLLREEESMVREAVFNLQLKNS